MIWSIILSWLKKNWMMIAVIVGVITIVLLVSASLNSDFNNLKNVIKEQSELNKKQMQEIQAIHDEEVETIKKNYDDYIIAIANIETKYDTEFKKLGEQKVEAAKKYINIYNGSPDKLATEIQNIFGVRYEK